jgi:hypothetical protein
MRCKIVKKYQVLKEIKALLIYCCHELDVTSLIPRFASWVECFLSIKKKQHKCC